jgi:NADH-quinone oxidoreductase subunit K
LQTYLTVGAILLGVGIYMILTKKNNILVLMGIELIFNAANLNLVAFGRFNQNIDGQVFILFIIMITACEAAVALAIVLNVFRYFRSIDSGKINEMKN